MRLAVQLTKIFGGPWCILDYVFVKHGIRGQARTEKCLFFKLSSQEWCERRVDTYRDGGRCEIVAHGAYIKTLLKSNSPTGSWLCDLIKNAHPFPHHCILRTRTRVENFCHRRVSGLKPCAYCRGESSIPSAAIARRTRSREPSLLIRFGFLQNEWSCQSQS